MEYTLKLDPETRDILFDEDGLLETIEGDAVYAQNTLNTLLTWKGEFMLDETHGTDYDRVLAQDYSDIAGGQADDVYREAIFQEDHIAVINDLSVSFVAERSEHDSRMLEVSFHGELTSGSPISMEVMKNV